MNRQNIIEAICYENFLLKTRYNELIVYIAKLEMDITNLKKTNSNENLNNVKVNNNNIQPNFLQKESEPAGFMNSPIILVDEPTITSAPIFQISKYCSSVNNIPYNMNDKTDTISELTM
jgi:hypothetical protein